MTNYDVVKKLIGEIDPVGASHIDDKRFANLESMCELVHELIYEIRYVAQNKDRQEYSMKKAGEFATNFLKEVKEV